MGGYVVLTNRKRAMVALAHSVVFLALAAYRSRGSVRPLKLTSRPSLWAMPFIYLAVSTVLIVLTRMAGNASERLCFGFCATSATFGLARQIASDPHLHVAVYVRVTMLACAVLTSVDSPRILDRPGGKLII